MKYFDHDVEAYKDDKIVLLRRECGGAAIDAYWTLLELIYREETEIKPTDNPVGFASVCFFLQVSEDDLKTYIEGMVKYGLLIQTDDGGLTSPRAVENIEGYKSRCHTNKANGGKGGRPRKAPVQTERKTDQKPTENPAETEDEPSEKQEEPSRGEKEKEKEKEKIYPQTPTAPPQDDFDEINDDGFACFGRDVLAVFNEETGSALPVLDGKTWCGLRRIFDAGRTLDDIRAVTRDKRDEWQPDQKMRRFIRPSTLYGEKFEEYLAVASQSAREEAEYDDYA